MRRPRLLLAVTLLTASMGVGAQSGAQYGPYDYTNPEHVRTKLGIVENYHFNADVENLRAGMTGTVAQDLAYTIRTFPNHHRALYAMARLWRLNEQQGKPPPGANPSQTPDYWFRRAIEFAPHDGAAPLLYGVHLHKQKKFNEALKYYKQAEQLLPDSVEVHYNLGLLYFEKKDYRLAKLHAEKAYDLGYPLPGLRNKLIDAGVWKQ